MLIDAAKLPNPTAKAARISASTRSSVRRQPAPPRRP